MKIMFSPIRSDNHLVLGRAGDVLIINGEAFDFSALPEGGCLPRAAVSCEQLASDVTRESGMICLTLFLPHGPDASFQALFPDMIVVTADGRIDLPIKTPMEELQ